MFGATGCTNRVYFGKINKIVVVIYGIILNRGDDVILTLEKIVERQIRVYPHRIMDHMNLCDFDLLAFHSDH